MNKKKTILVLDREYSMKYMKSDVFNVVVVCLQKKSRIKHEKEGLHVIGCFGEEYKSLPVADVPADYLEHSFDSDRFLSRFCFDKRREILGKEISFWSRLLDEYKPDCIINEVITIEFMEVMYLEARKRGIPYYTWGMVPFMPKDIWISEPPYHTRMTAGFWDTVNPDYVDYQHARDHIYKTRELGHKPFYICNLKTPNVLIRIAQAIHGLLEARLSRLIGLFSDEFIYEDYTSIFKWVLSCAYSTVFHKYDKLDDNENIDLLFYPLHLEPEAAVEYSGYFFNDQPMLIGRIAHCLKTNQKLVVKEHPQQEGALMTKRFRDLKRKYPNLIYLPGKVSSYSIYPKIKCLITLNGTAGFESWICRRPVVVFGEVFYKDFPGITTCDSFKQLYSIIRKDDYKIASERDIEDTVAKICHLLTDTFPYMDSNYREEYCMNLTKQFENLLDVRD